MFKKYSQLLFGILLGSILTCGIVFAENIRSFIAYEAQFPVVVDGTPIKLDMPVVTIEDRTYLPLRALGDVLGVKVDWNEEKQQAEIAKTLTPSTGETKDFRYEDAQGYLYGNIVDSSGKRYAAARELAEKSDFNNKNGLDLSFDENTGSACITKIYYRYECSQTEWEKLTSDINIFLVKDDYCLISLLKNIPVVLYNDRSYISLDYYETVMLPIIQANL